MPTWDKVLGEIQTKSFQCQYESANAVNTVRQQYLKKLSEMRDRNIICYYSGFLSKQNIDGTEINDEDKNGFMLTINELDRKKGLDLIIHTPGGDVYATDSLLNYLHCMFDNDIVVIVPQIAMSAGTLIACSSKEIIMGKQSNLGPVDPQVYGIPALGVIKEFEQIIYEIKKDKSSESVWLKLLEKYSPSFIGECEMAVNLMKKFLSYHLRNVMFKDADSSGNPEYIDSIVNFLTKSGNDNGHGVHIHIDDCISNGLKIKRLEDNQELQDLVLTIHHCYMHLLMNTPAFKIIENHNGKAMVKNLGNI